MFLFKLQPMYYNTYDWQISDAFSVTTPIEDNKFYDDSDKLMWEPFTSYQVLSRVRRGQNLYYSAKDNNMDDPFCNWVGSNPEGNNSWIKGRGLHDYDCINTISPGATQRTGRLSISLQYKKMAEVSEIAKFYTENTPTYLVLSGLRGDSVKLNFFNSTGDPVQAEKTIRSKETVERVRIIRDRDNMSEPELPTFIKDTIISVIPPSTERITIDIFTEFSGNFAKIGNIFIGKAYRIAKTEGVNISIGAIDYSRIGYDSWGKLSLQQGKRAKTLQGSFTLQNSLLPEEERILRLLQSCRATPTIFYGVNAIVLDTFLSALTMVCGIVKNAGITENSIKNKILDLRVDGIPVDYNP